MDLKTAAAIILATASIQTPEAIASTLGSETNAGELRLAPQQKSMTPPRNLQFQQVSPELQKAAMLINVRYGIPTHSRYNQSERAMAIKLAADLREALKLINTPEGRAYAAKTGLRPEKISQVQSSVQAFEKALKRESLQMR